MSGKPSFDLKLDRAEKHLIDLEGAIGAWCDTHPYEVRIRDESKRQRNVHRVEFTREVPDEISMIAADFIYNVRSGLDHLAAALVIRSRRSKTMFPILWQGVWGPVVEGDNEQRREERSKWESFTRTMHDGAIAILKDLQPPDAGPNNDKRSSGLAVINRIRNADAHSKLPIVSNRLLDPWGTAVVDGKPFNWVPTDMRAGHGLVHGAQIHAVPRGAVDVQIYGTVEVVMDIGLQEGEVDVRRSFREIAYDGTRRAIEALRPFVRS